MSGKRFLRASDAVIAMALLPVVRDTVPVGEGGGPLGVSATVFVSAPLARPAARDLVAQSSTAAM